MEKELRLVKTKNVNLNKAKNEKNDEFYTKLEDIEKEVSNYVNYFENKIIYCNCDDPKWSAFYKYFSLNFEVLKLKKLVTTHFVKNERERERERDLISWKCFMML